MSSLVEDTGRSVGRRRSLQLAVRFVGAALFGLGYNAAPAGAQGAKSREYPVKAAFIYNFIKYVDWPEQVLPRAGGSIVVGVLGRDPFGSSLAALAGKEVNGKRISLRHFNSVPAAGQAHILFIAASEQERLPQILSAVRSSSILTVGEVRGFAQSGGIINFVVENDKVRFEINPAAAERASLQLSSQLLRLARIVRA